MKGLVAVCVLVLSIGSRTSAAPAASSFRGDQARDGGFAPSSRAPTPTLRWSFATKGRVLSSPFVDAGTVYIGSEDGSLYAIDARRGVARWTFATKGPVSSSPVVAGELVYFTSYDGNVYAVNTKTGALAWKFADPSERRFEAKGIHGTRPAANTMPDPSTATSMRFDAGSGAQRWAVSTKGSWVVGTPGVRDGVVYVGTSDTALFEALDARTGAVRYAVETGGFMFSSPAVTERAAYIGAFDGKLYAFDLASGRTLWTYATKGARADAGRILEPDGRVDRDAVFAGGDYWQGSVEAVGKILSAGAILSSPAIADGVIYFGSADGSVYALE